MDKKDFGKIFEEAENNEIPNEETIMAMEDTELIGPFNTAEEFMADILEDPEWRKHYT
ncbi:hypothetical protein AGMMS49944_03590 [Spirochaetia bacterium]|nr:hypothetical protein AGMMS49944_03590 [Spirochaetia bacterium]